MDREIVIKLFFDFILVLIVFALTYLKSYSSEKGKNLATKKDIGEITKEIEIVKNELSFYNQSKLNWFIESKKNLVKFYDAYFIWVDDSLRISDILVSHHDNEVLLRKAIQNLKESHTVVSKYYWRLRIYNNDSVFIKSITKIYNDTAKKHNIVLHLFISLEDIVLQHRELADKSKCGIDIKEELEYLKREKNEAFDQYDAGKKALGNSICESKSSLVQIFKKKMNHDYAQFESGDVTKKR